MFILIKLPTLTLKPLFKRISEYLNKNPINFEHYFFIPDNQDHIFADHGFNLHVIFIYVWLGLGLASGELEKPKGRVGR